ncbi:MAG: outer membrane protein assembly factor BamD [Rhodospirillales bacterium]|nr:outer membrane protein assembly factor BamD [Rhodospirillales bacterium]
MTRGRIPLSLVAFAVAILLAGCASKEEPYVERPIEELYNEAMDALQAGKYDTAARQFDEVERQHPYSSWATKAQLMAAYGHYQKSAYDDAIVALDRFIQLHPSNRDTPYAYYLKALCYYEQISDVRRDQKMTQEAKKTLEELVTRFPESTYAKDARVKMDLTQDHLAGKTMEIGRYYLRQGHYLAAINRFRYVIDNHQTTTHVPEALLRLTEAYLALGLADEAKRTAAVLGHNFPGSEWYVDAYELLEQKRIRPQETAWYKFWEGDAEPPKAEKIEADSAKKESWYKFW